MVEEKEQNFIKNVMLFYSNINKSWSVARKERKALRQDLFKCRLKAEKKEQLSTQEQSLVNGYIKQLPVSLRVKGIKSFPELWDIGDPSIVRHNSSFQGKLKSVASYLTSLDTVVFEDKIEGLNAGLLQEAIDYCKTVYPIEQSGMRSPLFHYGITLYCLEKCGGATKWL